jgi:magnesium-transporting ATPase (P-type)
MAQPVQQPITQQGAAPAPVATPITQQGVAVPVAQPLPQQVAQYPQQYPVTGYQPPYAMAPKKNMGAAITGLVLAIISMIMFFVTKSISVDEYTLDLDEVKNTCNTWMIMFWISLVILVVAWVLIIVSLVKKNHGPVVITAIVFASIALIVLFVCMTDYSDVKDTLDMVDRYTSSYRGWNY